MVENNDLNFAIRRLKYFQPNTLPTCLIEVLNRLFLNRILLIRCHVQLVSLGGLISELAINAKMKRTVDKINLDTCCS